MCSYCTSSIHPIETNVNSRFEAVMVALNLKPSTGGDVKHLSLGLDTLDWSAVLSAMISIMSS